MWMKRGCTCSLKWNVIVYFQPQTNPHISSKCINVGFRRIYGRASINGRTMWCCRACSTWSTITQRAVLHIRRATWQTCTAGDLDLPGGPTWKTCTAGDLDLPEGPTWKDLPGRHVQLATWTYLKDLHGRTYLADMYSWRLGPTWKDLHGRTYLIDMYSWRLGPPKLRQLRVAKGSVPLRDLSNEFFNCC